MIYEVLYWITFAATGYVVFLIYLEDLKRR
jgi:hypothetical protein